MDWTKILKNEMLCIKLCNLAIETERSSNINTMYSAERQKLKLAVQRWLFIDSVLHIDTHSPCLENSLYYNNNKKAFRIPE